MVSGGMTQIPTGYGGDDGIHINGLMMNYAYTPQQVIEALGQPTDSCSWINDWDERESEFVYKTGEQEDLVIRFGTLAQGMGIQYIALCSNRFSIYIYGITYMIGESVNKFRNRSDFVSSDFDSTTRITRFYYDLNRDFPIAVTENADATIRAIVIEPPI